MRRIGKRIKLQFRKAFSKFNNLLEYISVPMNIFGTLLIIIICILALSSCIVYFQLENGGTPRLFFFKVLSMFGIIESKEISIEYITKNREILKSAVEFLVNTSVAISGLILSFITFFSYLIKVTTAKRKSCFKKKEIFESGKEDIDIMLSYFKGANRIVIYSVTFNWVNRNEKMQKLLESKSKENKLQLYASDIDAAKANIKNTAIDESCLKSTNCFLRFSYIERDNAKYLLYRQEENQHTFIYIVHENAESMYLLKAISGLVGSV